MQTFLAWGEARGKAEVDSVQSSKNFVMMLILVVALAAAGVIVLAWLSLRHMLLKPLDTSIQQLEHVAAGNLTEVSVHNDSNEFNRLHPALANIRYSPITSLSRVRHATLHIDSSHLILT